MVCSPMSGTTPRFGYPRRELSKELQNPGHASWDPFELFPNLNIDAGNSPRSCRILDIRIGSLSFLPNLCFCKYSAASRFEMSRNRYRQGILDFESVIKI